MGIKNRRRILAEFFIEWTNRSAKELKARQKNGSVDWNKVAVEWAVMLGHCEDRPMGASQISALISVPRTTVIRILGELIDDGVVQKVNASRYCLTSDRLENPTMKRASKDLSNLVLKAAAGLSMLDS